MTYITKNTFPTVDDIAKINKAFSPFSIGLFDNLGFDEIKRFEKGASNYPPYNIKRKGDEYIIEIAVAGFSKEAITIEYKDRTLIVKGEHKNEKEEGVEYLHNGLAGRSFTRTFALADTVYVESAALNDGIISISCKQLIPEHLKPKTITITGGDVKLGVTKGEPQLLCESDC